VIHRIAVILARLSALFANGAGSAVYREPGLWHAVGLAVLLPAATNIDLAINLKTAKALGLTIPETPLASAGEVIQ
jgi:hypothetical protein